MFSRSCPNSINKHQLCLGVTIFKWHIIRYVNAILIVEVVPCLSLILVVGVRFGAKARLSQMLISLKDCSDTISLTFDKIYYYHYYTLCEYFQPALADGLWLEPEWQQVSAGLQNSSYSGLSQQCNSQEGHCFSSTILQVYN